MGRITRTTTIALIAPMKNKTKRLRASYGISAGKAKKYLLDIMGNKKPFSIKVYMVKVDGDH